MRAQETHFLDNELTWNIAVAPYRRQIIVPVLAANAPSGKNSSHAVYRLVFNGAEVARASADGGSNTQFIPGTVASTVSIPYSYSETRSWIGFIEANQAASILVSAAGTNGNGSTPQGVTVLIGTP
ncbi:hypothetical protein [Serratia fonticola]